MELTGVNLTAEILNTLVSMFVSKHSVNSLKIRAGKIRRWYFLVFPLSEELNGKLPSLTQLYPDCFPNSNF